MRGLSRKTNIWSSRLAMALAFLLLVTAIPLAGGVEAEEEAGEGPIVLYQGMRFLQPIQKALGGSSWAAVTGYDPRFLPMQPGREAVGAWDWSTSAAGGGSGSRALNQQVPFRNPAPAFSRNLIVTRQLGLFPIQTEPHLAVNPYDPEHIVLGVIDYNFSAMSTYTSFDGGETWDGPNQVRYFREDFLAAGDPVLTFDQDENVYITSISLGFQEFQVGNLASAAEVSSMQVAKSVDGGLTWLEPVSAARSTVTTVSSIDPEGLERGTITIGFLDKPWMTSGPNPNDPEADSIYLTYTDFETTYGLLYADEVPFLSSGFTETTIRMVRSDDGGVTWTEPVPVSPTVLVAEGASQPGEGEGEARGLDFLGIQRPGGNLPYQEGVTQEDDDGFETQQGETELEANRTVQGSQPKVLPDGTLVIAYVDTTNDGIQEGLMTIMVTTSPDGGETFTNPVAAGVFREPHFTPRNTEFRYWGAAFPQLAVGPDGEIYVVTTGLPVDKPNDDGDIYLMRSFDTGQSWEEPLRINTDQTSRLQFFPSIDVDEEGMVHLMWGDMRDDPDEVRYHIYYSRSEDQGATWGFTLEDQDFTAPDTRVTDFASNSLRGFPGGRFLGDYFSLAATEGEVYMVWADTRLGEFGGPNQQIGFARQTAIRSPELFLNPPSGPSGRTVDIQGFGFQPESNIQLVVGGVIFSNERTDENGEFQTQIFMPVTGEGASNIAAYDETGNVAIASFYTEFGFDTIQDALEQINETIDADAGAPPATTAVASPVAATPVVAASPAAASPVAASPVPASPVVGASPVAGTPTSEGTPGSSG